MSILKDNQLKMKCYNLTESGKIIKNVLQNIDNQEDNSMTLVEINFFGINQVYSLINISKVKEIINNINNLESENRIKCDMLSLTRVIGDSPIIEDINLKTRSIYLNDLTYFDWIALYQLSNILDGMNYISDIDIQYDLQIGECLDEPHVDFSKLDFSLSEYNDFKYILKFKNDTYVFSNSIPYNLIDNEDISGIFINIPEFKCWQYLSKKKFINLNYPNNVEIKYAITDSPRCFSKVAYFNMYSISDFSNLLIYCIYIPVDIYFRKEFDNIENSNNKKSYDAIEIVIDDNEYMTSVLLTHDELGIESLKGKSNNILFMDNFCLLKLINNIICIKPNK